MNHSVKGYRVSFLLLCLKIRVSIDVIKSHDQKKLGEARVYLAFRHSQKSGQNHRLLLAAYS